jgi:hypothetical protein
VDIDAWYWEAFGRSAVTGMKARARDVHPVTEAVSPRTDASENSRVAPTVQIILDQIVQTKKPRSSRTCGSPQTRPTLPSEL